VPTSPNLLNLLAGLMNAVADIAALDG